MKKLNREVQISDFPPGRLEELAEKAAKLIQQDLEELGYNVEICMLFAFIKQLPYDTACEMKKKVLSFKDLSVPDIVRKFKDQSLLGLIDKNDFDVFIDCVINDFGGTKK